MPALFEQYRVYASTRLSYYSQDGNLLEGYIDDIGTLLRHIRPFEYDLSASDLPNVHIEEDRRRKEKYINEFKAHGGALYFYGSLGRNTNDWDRYRRWETLPKEVRDPEPEPCTYTPCLGIQLYTDIWLPQVVGGLEHTRNPGKYKHNEVHLFDNRELANRHTPRLNSFLQSVKQLIEQRGGTWHYEDYDSPDEYKPMYSNDGIIL